MKQLLVLILLLPFVARAQSIEAMNQSLHKRNHVKSITAYKIVDGQKRILEQKWYDTAGYPIKHVAGNSAAGSTSDTIVRHGSGFTRIVSGDKKTDSTTFHYDTISGDRTYTTYHEGKITHRQISTGDSVYGRMIDINNADTLFRTKTVYAHRYTYDDKGRVLTREATDSIYYGSGGGLLMSLERYDYVYTDKGFVHTTYDNGSSMRAYASLSDVKTYKRSVQYYTRGTIRVDSTIYYGEKGKIRKINIHYTDSTGRDLEYRATDKRGNVEYRIVWVYEPGQITRQTFGSKGELQFTLITTINEKGLITKEAGSGIEGDHTVYYEYTFHP